MLTTVEQHLGHSGKVKDKGRKVHKWLLETYECEKADAPDFQLRTR